MSTTQAQKQRQAAAQRRKILEEAQRSYKEMAADYQRIHAEAEELSGTPRMEKERAEHYWKVYEDSQGNLVFPLIATHGSLWGVNHTKRLQRMLGPLNALSRNGRVQRWIDTLEMFQDINRRVFVEIWSTFYFTQKWGRHAGAWDFVKPEVLALYNQVHAANEAGQPLSDEERRLVYYNVFVHEQMDIVDPGIAEACEYAQNPMVVEICKRVSPRFAYFPRDEALLFTDFTSVHQRNREGLRAYDFAMEVGPERVREAMGEY